MHTHTQQVVEDGYQFFQKRQVRIILYERHCCILYTLL